MKATLLRLGLSLSLFLSIIPLPAQAGPASPDTFPLTQPDGTTFQARLYGDEWNSGIETADGYTILKDPQTEYWVYAALNRSGNLVPTSLRVGIDRPVNLQRHLRPRDQSRPAFAPSLGSFGSAPPLFSGNIPLLVILVQFTNQAPIGSTAADWAGQTFGPSGTVEAYYKEVSYNQLDLDPATETHGTANDGIIGWLSLSQSHPNTGPNTNDTNRQLARDALIAADPYINYKAFDTDNNGAISNNELLIMIIAAGYEASFSNSQFCGNSVWGHAWSLGGTVTAPTLDGVLLANFSSGGGYTQFGEWMGCLGQTSINFRSTIGIMVHEIGHLLNWPDLYDTDGSSAGVGDWSVMGSGSWGQSSLPGDTPVHPDAFSKIYQGWVTPTAYDPPAFASPLNVNVPQAATNPFALQVLPNPGGVDWLFNLTSGTGEYFLIENRQQVGFDASLPGCGLLIWHIDEARPPDNTANANEDNPLIDLEEADGLDDLYWGLDQGDAGDPYPGSSMNTVFSATSYPNSDFYGGTDSHVRVDVLSTSCASTMQVRLSTTFTDFLFLSILHRN